MELERLNELVVQHPRHNCWRLVTNPDDPGAGLWWRRGTLWLGVRDCQHASGVLSSAEVFYKRHSCAYLRGRSTRRRCAMRFLTRPGPADQSSRYPPWTSTSSDGCDDATFSKKVGRLPFRRRAVPVSGTERLGDGACSPEDGAATFEGHAPVSHKGLSERSKARRRGILAATNTVSERDRHLTPHHPCLPYAHSTQ